MQKQKHRLRSVNQMRQKGVAGLGLVGAGLEARSTFRVGGDKLSKKVADAVTKDAITLDKINKVVDKINARGVRPEDRERAQKFLDESVKNRFNHNVSATTKMSNKGFKKLVKAERELGIC